MSLNHSLEYPVELRIGNVTLRGTAHRPSSAPHPVVILYHGFTGNRMGNKFLFVRFARKLAAEGLGCVRFDFSGSGESDGEFSEMTLGGEIEEGKEILRYVRQMEGVDPAEVFLCGFSMGGVVATHVAAQMPEFVRGLCLWAPAGNMLEIAEECFRTGVPLPGGGVEVEALAVGRPFYEELKQWDLYEGISSYTGPVLILHGDRDEAVPPAWGRRYLQVYGASARFHSIRGADHVFSRISWREELISESIAFFKSVPGSGSDE